VGYWKKMKTIYKKQLHNIFSAKKEPIKKDLPKPKNNKKINVIIDKKSELNNKSLNNYIHSIEDKSKSS